MLCERPDEGEFAENASAKNEDINLLQELAKTLNSSNSLCKLDASENLLLMNDSS